MKRFFTFLLLNLLMITGGVAQKVGNEWVNYNQSYVRISIVAKGIYRIHYDALEQAFRTAGLNINADIAGFEMYARGEQIPLYIHSSSSTLTQGSYIEFYGIPNDGWFDTQLYPNQISPNPYYSLFNDTASYYLTWNLQLKGLRYHLVTDKDFSRYNNLPYITAETLTFDSGTYTEGELFSQNVASTLYNACEGWMSGRFGIGGNTPRNLATPNVYTAGPPAEISMSVCGLTALRHHLRVTFLGQTLDTIYTGFKFFKIERSVSASSLSATNRVLFESIKDGLSAARDDHAVSFVKIRYPHTNGSSVSLPVNFWVGTHGSGLRNVLSFTSSSVTAGDSAILYDLNSREKILVERNENSFKALINNSGEEKEIYITSGASVKTVTLLTPVNGNGKFTNFTQSEYTNAKFVIIAHPSLWQSAISYRDYRQYDGFPETFNSVAVNVEELYDQFAYGIRKCPTAIQNFAKFLLPYNKVEHFFLIGKGYRSSASGTYSTYRKTTATYRSTLIPAYGSPPSDAALVYFSLDGNPNNRKQQISIGRIAAKTNEDVFLYLNKVKQYENALKQPQVWMKNILHFAGGNEGAQNATFKGFLKNLEDIAAKPHWGAFTRTFSKTSTLPIEINQSQYLKNIINNGVALMTFFGHASGVGFDMSIDNPEDYDNNGKYPFLIGNSCYAGDIFLEDIGINTSSSMRFTFQTGKGTIGYISAVSSGLDRPMYEYSKQLYTSLALTAYGKTFGKALQTALNTFSPNDNANLPSVLDLIYQGDPALAFYYAEKPDFSIDTLDMRLSASSITTEMSYFDFHATYYNLGKAVSDSNFTIEVHYKYADESDTTYFIVKNAPCYADSLILRLPVDRLKSSGENHITLRLDPNNLHEELNKSNNTATLTFFVKSTGILPVYPQNYAIYPHDRVILKASTGLPLENAQDYEFQIDVNPYFSNGNGKGMASTAIRAPGGILEWSVPFHLKANQVYYWRVKSATDSIWKTSSFEYYPDKTGSGQSDFYQFKDNNYTYVRFNETERKFDFVQNVKQISVQTFFSTYPGFQWQDIYTKVNGAVLSTNFCLNGNGLKIMVFDPISGEPWMNKYLENQTSPNEDYRCRSYETYCFDFYTTNNTWLNRIENFIRNIPDSHYVLIYSCLDMRSRFFPESLYQAFENLGSTQIRDIQTPRPYILFGMKNAAANDPRIHEVLGMDNSSKIEMHTEIITNWDEGIMETVPFGPAPEWFSMQYDIKKLNEGDTNSVSLFGGNLPDGSSQILISNLTKPALEIPDLSAYFNTKAYPYAKVAVKLKDPVLNTPAQPKAIRLFHETAPETAISPSDYFVFSNHNVMQGDSILFGIATRNISDKDMDSLLVAYRIFENNRPLWTHHKRLAPHPAGTVLKDSIKIGTRNLSSGEYILQVFFNPNHDQPELHDFNNFAEVEFFIRRDTANPILDVTFDGVHILDRELVSAKPVIKIELADENKYLLMNELGDTNLFQVSLMKPGSNTYQRIYFYQNGFENMEFIPAHSAQNKCKILWHPTFEEDGIYTLQINARDKSDNESGKHSYSISFEVVNKSTITGVFNYPNPFSTSTRFVFTLTGSETPTDLKITIMTISGKIVKEIDLAEFGPIRVGNNISQYAWDGRDMYGDLLANGVYLYRVITRINGVNIEKKQSISASKYFKHDFGKLVIMR